jgi:parvulin-like peptidyl-prolyl isomerase
MREKVLDVLIGQELMWQVAKKEQTMATDEEVSQAFDQAAFDLVEPGDVSGIVETRFGLHLIQLIDKKPSVKVEEADASEQIKIYLWQQGYRRAVGGAVENLKEQAVIQKSN